MAARAPWAAFLIGGLLALGAGLYFGLQLTTPKTPVIAGLVLPQARALPDFHLEDQDGKAFGKASMAGRWTVLAYGYTHCPDICPTTLASLAAAAREIARRDPAAYRDFRFAFLSVDPGRDSAERLKTYVPFFHPDFIGLRPATGGDEDLVKALGIIALVNPPTDPAKPDVYPVDHGIAMYLIDNQARLRAILRPDGAGAASGAYDPQRLASDILALHGQG